MISELLSALAAPGDYTRGLLAGDLGQRYTGDQLLRHYGFDPSGVGGGVASFATSVATDPLTWLPFTGVTKLAGRGLGALGEAAGLTGRASEAAGAAEGLAGLGEAAGVSGTGIGELGNVSNLRQLRPMYTMAKDLHLDDLGQPAARLVGGMPYGDVNRARTVMGGLDEIAQDAVEASKIGGRLHGQYDPATGLGAVMRDVGDPVLTARHENVHAFIDQASKAGRTDLLPLSMRVPAQLQSSSSPALKALGRLGEETTAHSVMGRGFADQLRRGANFLNSANPYYADEYSNISPLVGAMYRYSVPQRAAAVAGGVGGGFLLNNLLNNRE